ncbi:MAG: hypothetical protein B6I38_04280 [Anaerolineaceae bacterium 4572_5.1]|nr:MAG: hypothetical protein B5M51_03590 [Anaerolinea sp. 4484_236]OQY32737.1 MAG: hypothetical protein B6I38_04280 [Anaerolineaceae bacterium 4572_5.1]
MNAILERLKNPIVAALIAVVVGFVLGLWWGWGVDPVVWTDTAPDILNPFYQEEYLRMTIDSFSVNSDPALALRRWQALGENAPQRLEAIKRSPNNQDQAIINVFGQLMETTGGAALAPIATPDEAAEEKTSSSLKYILIFVGVVVVFAVGFFALRLLRPLSKPDSDKATPVQRGLQISRDVEKTDFSKLGLATPITQSMTTYIIGDDLYDESFSIDSQAGEFMGEFGVGISETIGVGDPKKVAAFEVWLFDKNDIKTATKVLMSEHAYNDPSIRQRLEAKGELVILEPQNQIKLETATLQLLVTISDMEYGGGSLPPSSYFDRVTLELAVWPKG